MTELLDKMTELLDNMTELLNKISPRTNYLMLLIVYNLDKIIISANRRNEISLGLTFFFLNFKVFNVPSVARNCSVVPQQDGHNRAKHYSCLQVI